MTFGPRPRRRPRAAGSLGRGEHPAVDLALVARAARSGWNHSASSAAAFSGLSEAWTRFWAVSRAKSPRIEPGAASCGRVAPFIARTIAIAFGPSRAAATSGARVMKSTRPAKNGFSRWTA